MLIKESTELLETETPTVKTETFPTIEEIDRELSIGEAAEITSITMLNSHRDSILKEIPETTIDKALELEIEEEEEEEEDE